MWNKRESQMRLLMATADSLEVPSNWMPATGIRPVVFEDPAIIWLEHHGRTHGFQSDTSEYAFIDFIRKKSEQFEEKWKQEMAPDAIRICDTPFSVRSVEKVRETFDLMQQGAPVIVQPALWWAPERIYGVPDLIVHTSWLAEQFPNLLSEATMSLEGKDQLGSYVVCDFKLTKELKNSDLQAAEAQVRIYSYILGHLQGVMPHKAYLITKSRISNPRSVTIQSTRNQPLDEDLAALRDKFVDIKQNGANYLPWRDEIVASNLSHDDERWRTAKQVIARERFPGRDPALLYQVGWNTKRQLTNLGFSSLNAMLLKHPQEIPFEKCKGLGHAKTKRIRKILQANRSGVPALPLPQLIPAQKRFEFYIDFEFLTNINVNFDDQWPTLDGCEMIFMIGVGWEEKGQWAFETFIAAAEDQSQERQMLEEFIDFLQAKTGGAVTDTAKTAIYHWTDAEKTQTSRTIKRHQFPDNHPLCNLPWCDLNKVFLDGPVGIPGAWNYKLKTVARAIGKLNRAFDSPWPEDLDNGCDAMVMGWKAYQQQNPLQSKEMELLKEYLEVDCKALWNILKWLRS